MFEKVGKPGYCEVAVAYEQQSTTYISVDPSGSFLYAGGQNTSVLYKINADSLTKIGEHDSGYVVFAQFHPQRNEIFTRYISANGSSWARYSYDKNTGIITKIREIASSSTIYGSLMTFDTYGRFFYGLEADTAQVRRFDVMTTNGSLNLLGTVAVSGTIPNPRGLICHPNGNFLYVVNTNTQALQTYSINQTTGILTSLGTISITGSTSPSTIICDPAGKFLYISDPGTNIIFCYTINQTTGAVTSAGTIVSGTGATGFYIEMFCESTGKFLYATNRTSNTVSTYTINQTTGMLTFSGTISATSPLYVICDPTSKFAYIANNAEISYYTINSTTGLLNYAGSIAQTSIYGFYCDPTGNFLYVAIYAGLSNCSFRSYAINQSTGALTLMAVSPSSAQSINFFRGDPAGKFLYIVDLGAGTAQSYAIDANTGNITFTGTYTLAGTPWGIVTSPNGNYAYVSVTGAPYNITMYSVNNGFAYLGTTSVSVTTPWAIRADKTGKFIYVTGNSGTLGAMQAYSINQTTGALTAVGSVISISPSEAILDLIIDKYNRYLYAIVATNQPSIYAYSINQSTGALTSIGIYGDANAANQYTMLHTTDLNSEFFYHTAGSSVNIYSINQSTGALTLAFFTSLYPPVYQLVIIPNKNRYFASQIFVSPGLLITQSDYSTSTFSDTKKINTKNKLPYDVKEKITNPIKRNPVYWGN